MEIRAVIAVVGMSLVVVLVAVAFLWCMGSMALDGHPTFCTCEKCRQEAIEREVERREWEKQQDEIVKAVRDLER